MTTIRDPKLMHIELQEAVAMTFKRYKLIYPKDPQPFITETYRGREAQEEAYRKGLSKARFGESLHNFTPCYACDFGFKFPNGSVSWDEKYFAKLGKIAEEQGLEWGGSWKSFKDTPHLQLRMTLQDARMGRVPKINDLNRWVSALARFWRGLSIKK